PPADPLSCIQGDFGYGLSWAGVVNSDKIGPEPEPMRGITEAHNAVRRFVGVPELVWSDALAVNAQGWADTLADDLGCVLQHAPANQRPGQGENLAMGGASDGSTMKLEEAVGGWACEREDWDNSAMTCNGEVGFGEFPRLCGHYTQLVWADTTEVGCGASECSQGGFNFKIWACRYSPPGNFVNASGVPMTPY
ncbi:hypothetical protein KKB55_15420, partial [Myxococcota bacterium]|nr:hypothetical protein [Myxococcota bacterium]